MKKNKKNYSRKNGFLKHSSFDPLSLFLLAFALTVTGIYILQQIFAQSSTLPNVGLTVNQNPGGITVPVHIYDQSRTCSSGNTISTWPSGFSCRVDTGVGGTFIFGVPDVIRDYKVSSWHTNQWGGDLSGGSFDPCTVRYNDSSVFGTTVDTCSLSFPATNGNYSYVLGVDYTPLPPTISGSGGNGSVSISWQARAYTSRYDIYRSNTKVATVTNVTSYSMTGLACATSYPVFIKAIDTGNNNLAVQSNTLNLSTASCPSPPPPPPPSKPPTPPPPPGTNPTPPPSTTPPGSNPSPTPGSGSGSNPSSNPSPIGSKTTAPKPTAPVAKPTNNSDTQAPGSPGNLLATAQDNTVNLTWNASKDNVGVAGYVVERSTDSITWEKIADSVSATSYTDKDVQFITQYYYRVSAYDAAGNVSTPAVTDIVTSGFHANVLTDEDKTITSDDGLVSAKITSGTFDVDAECTLADNQDPGLLTKQQKLLAGAYQLSCDDSNDAHLTDLSNPVTYTIHRKDKLQKAKLAVQVSNNGSWTAVKLSTDKEPSFSSDQTIEFIIVKAKTTNWVAVIFVIFVLVGLFAALLGAIAWYRRRSDDDYNSYMSDDGSGSDGSDIEEMTGYNDSHPDR
jgi:hypothetical protein